MTEYDSEPEEPPDVAPLLWPRTVEHPDEFIRELTGITSHWHKEHGVTRPWFRGSPKLSFTLEPSLLRYRPRPLLATEGNLCEMFRSYGSRLLDDPPRSELELMTIMQHHGVPTRLLDWSENAIAALYFAVRPREHFDAADDAVVWILEPLMLTHLRRAVRRIPYSDDSLIGCPTLPLPVYPVHKSSRVTPQRGTFTFHPFEPKHSLAKLALAALDRDGKTFLRGIRIAGHRRSFIRSGLVDAFGLGEFTFFPDLDGLSRELRIRENLEGKG